MAKALVRPKKPQVKRPWSNEDLRLLKTMGVGDVLPKLGRSGYAVLSA